MLSILGDEYARRVLRALSEESLPAAALVDRLDASRATIYRRLDRLESAGIVGSVSQVHPEGHHRKQFHVDFECARLQFDDHGVAVELEA